MLSVEGNERTFEAMGFAPVKSVLFNGGLPADQSHDATRRAAKCEEEGKLRQLEDRRREKAERRHDKERQVAFEADPRRLGRSTNVAAWIAAFGAIAAGIVALIAWLLSRT